LADKTGAARFQPEPIGEGLEPESPEPCHFIGCRKSVLVPSEACGMLLTITTTHQPADDLGYLLHKHPERFQSFDLSFGKAHVYDPEVGADRCAVPAGGAGAFRIRLADPNGSVPTCLIGSIIIRT
jgi:hypothetical protein